MKKKLITIVIGAMLCAGLFAGCGQSDTKQDKAVGTESAKQADIQDISSAGPDTWGVSGSDSAEQQLE